MLVLFNTINNYYFQNKGKIILFNSIDEANNFAFNFFQYAIQRMVNENPIGIPAVMTNESHTIIKEVDFDLSKVETININELS
jgi:hypothetical protein